MASIDYLILALYFVISIVIALLYSKRSSSSTEEFFLSGRNLPWYLAGLSMVATTFAADTPLAVTELVAKNGIAGNWLWWNFVFGGLITVFFYAKLWRRAGIMTEAEFADIRYSGKPAKFLRGFRAVYLGLFMNIIILGWVNKAMMSIIEGLFGIPPAQIYFYVFGCLVLVAIYSALSGLWGVVITDAFQFILAMTGCIILAVIVVNSGQVGGIAGLKAKLPSFVFDFFPHVGVSAAEGGKILALTFSSFLAYIGIQWWASWYPGQEPGGGGYVAQRIMSAKNEKHSLFAALFFQVAHYALRPWPWIIVGLCSLVLYPELSDAQKGLGFVYAMRDFLPAGLKGLLVASFFAAYMSTIATQLNWGASYLMNDFYRPLKKTVKTEKHYVLISRLFTLLLMFCSVVVTMFLSQISGAWQFVMECGAGLGGVLLLRWYWWRVNAYSEISAMFIPFILMWIIRAFTSVTFPDSLFILVPGTTLGWLAVTYMTKPVDEEKLLSFYTRIRPGGALWRPIAQKLPAIQSDFNLGNLLLLWVLGVVLVYTMLFSIGNFIFGEIGYALVYLLIAFAAFSFIYRKIK